MRDEHVALQSRPTLLLHSTLSFPYVANVDSAQLLLNEECILYLKKEKTQMATYLIQLKCPMFLIISQDQLDDVNPNQKVTISWEFAETTFL